MHENSEVPAAERYGVASFDLRKKVVIVEAAWQYMPKSQMGIQVFCTAINELHFDGANGRIVSLDDAKKIAKRCDEARELFDAFLKNNSHLFSS